MFRPSGADGAPGRGHPKAQSKCAQLNSYLYVVPKTESYGVEGLSEFQDRVVAFSLREAAAKGLSLQKELLVDARSGESFACLKAEATGIEIWIYPDGANILAHAHAHALDRRIEAQDFDSAESMEERTLSEIRAVLAGGR